jgi:hypothetical protein
LNSSSLVLGGLTGSTFTAPSATASLADLELEALALAAGGPALGLPTAPAILDPTAPERYPQGAFFPIPGSQPLAGYLGQAGLAVGSGPLVEDDPPGTFKMRSLVGMYWPSHGYIAAANGRVSPLWAAAEQFWHAVASSAPAIPEWAWETWGHPDQARLLPGTLFAPPPPIIPEKSEPYREIVEAEMLVAWVLAGLSLEPARQRSEEERKASLEEERDRLFSALDDWFGRDDQR